MLCHVPELSVECLGLIVKRERECMVMVSGLWSLVSGLWSVSVFDPGGGWWLTDWLELYLTLPGLQPQLWCDTDWLPPPPAVRDRPPAQQQEVSTLHSPHWQTSNYTVRHRQRSSRQHHVRAQDQSQAGGGVRGGETLVVCSWLGSITIAPVWAWTSGPTVTSGVLLSTGTINRYNNIHF